MSSIPPQTIGRYQIIREINRSNDIVYEGYDNMLQRRVAIKWLHIAPNTSSASIAEKLERFNREGRAVSALSHPNIMAIYGADVENGNPYLVLELVDGQNLREVINQMGHFDLQNVRRILGPLLDALSHCHSKNLVHRDIKPENIQVQPSGQSKLMDFGIAKNDADLKLTKTGVLFGTPKYMAPEQFVGAPTPASDLFAMGAIAFEMLTGQQAFPGSDAYQVMHAVNNLEPAYPSTLSSETVSFLKRSLAKHPANRFQSASEMLASLEQIGQQKPAASTPISQPLLPQNPQPVPVPPQPIPAQVVQQMPQQVVQKPLQVVNQFLKGPKQSIGTQLQIGLIVISTITVLAVVFPEIRLALGILDLTVAAIFFFRFNDVRRAIAAPFAFLGLILILWHHPTPASAQDRSTVPLSRGSASMQSKIQDRTPINQTSTPSARSKPNPATPLPQPSANTSGKTKPSQTSPQAPDSATGRSSAEKLEEQPLQPSKKKKKTPEPDEDDGKGLHPDGELHGGG